MDFRRGKIVWRITECFISSSERVLFDVFLSTRVYIACLCLFNLLITSLFTAMLRSSMLSRMSQMWRTTCLLLDRIDTNRFLGLLITKLRKRIPPGVIILLIMTDVCSCYFLTCLYTTIGSSCGKTFVRKRNASGVS